MDALLNIVGIAEIAENITKTISSTSIEKRNICANVLIEQVKSNALIEQAKINAPIEQAKINADKNVCIVGMCVLGATAIAGFTAKTICKLKENKANKQIQNKNCDNSIEYSDRIIMNCDSVR